jgi:prevent-host-death family protein
MATTVGVRQLKNELSRYLRLVRKGTEVVVLDRGHPVALLRGLTGSAPADSEDERLARLAARGLVKLGNGKRLRFRPLDFGPDVKLSEAVIEDREDRI